MAWIRACDSDALADGEAVVVERDDGPPVAVFRVDHEFFAVDDTCTHDNYSLADGYIDGPIVECPLHMAKFDVRTGKVLCLPATRDLAAYPVKVEAGVVFVEV
ncbi:MAG: bifunctional 3-phenylpropionate/cinnamic acid dioxygenase ferredoxin subunit [Ilumatobacteraceae bacterium]